MSFSTGTGIALIDSRRNGATLTLPSATDVAGRILYVKDAAGSFGLSSILLSTITGQAFDNGQNTLQMNEAGGYTLLVSDGSNTWNQLGGTRMRETYTKNANISTLSVQNTVSSLDTYATRITTRSTLEFNNLYAVGPNTSYYRGDQLFTPLQMAMTVYDLPLSTITDLTPRINVLSTFTAGTEFAIPIDFGAYPYNKVLYSTTVNDVNLNLKTRALNIKLWGVGGNGGKLNFDAPPGIKGGAAAFIKVTGFYPSYRFGEYLDPVNYTLSLQSADTSNLGYPDPVVSTISGDFNNLYTLAARGSVYGPILKIPYQGEDYGILSPAGGGGAVYQSNATTYTESIYNGYNASLLAVSTVDTVFWSPNLENAANGFGTGGAGAIIGTTNSLNGGGGGTNLNNLQKYGNPFSNLGYNNGSITITTADNPNSISDPDWIAAGYGPGLGGSGNEILGNALASNPLAVIEQPYDRLDSNLTFVGQGSITALIDGPVTFRLTGPDGLILSINGESVIYDWTSSNMLRSISTIYNVNVGHTYNLAVYAYNAITNGNTFQLEYYIEQNQILGNFVQLGVSSGVFYNNVSSSYVSSLTTNSLYSKTLLTQNMQISPGYVNSATPFYSYGSGTFGDTLTVQSHLSVSKNIYASSITLSSIRLQNTFSQSGSQKLELYDSTITIGSLQLLSQLNIGGLVLNSTVQGLGSSRYLSSLDTVQNYNFVSSLSLQSTVQGLGSSRYLSSLDTVQNYNFVSSLSLQSTVRGLGSIGYVSTPIPFNTVLTSTVSGLGSSRYVSTASLQSTVVGLGSSRYLSTPSLQSTVVGLGTAGFLSSYDAFGTVGYVSSVSLISSVVGLGTYGYLSTFTVQSSISSGSTSITIYDNSTITFNTYFGEKMRINTAGLIGMWTSSPTAVLDISGSLIVRSTVYISTGSLVINRSYNSIPNAELDVNGTGILNALFVNTQGTFGTTVTAQSFATPSDSNLKMDINTISTPMAIIDKTRGVNFSWKNNDVKDYGYIAQEVEKYLPEAVLKQNSTLYVRYDIFVPIITEALKDLQSQINMMKIEISSMH